MATYNWATVLPYSIGSALDQTYRDFELLVIGDGCTDESAEVISRIADRRVRWHNLETNHGHQYAPNNHGIAHGGGDIVAYLGHDDLWLPRHLELLVAAIDQGARIAHGTVLVVNPGEEPFQWSSAAWAYRPARETGIADPDTDLWKRMAAVGGPPRWLQRLTCVRLPAASRRAVYRRRPHHEQEAWLHRIRTHDDPEAAFTKAYRDSAIDVHSPARGLVNWLRSTVALRTRLRKLGVLPAAAPAAPAAPAESAEERRVATRAFKGLN